MILDIYTSCIILLSYFNKYNLTLGFGVIGCVEQLIIFNQVSLSLPETNLSNRKSIQGSKIIKYSPCPAGRVTYNFHLSCKHMHLSFKSVCKKEH